MVTAMLLRRYKVRFSPDYDPDTLVKELRDTVTAQPGTCRLIFEPW